MNQTSKQIRHVGRQSGFTLIELIMVIVILGILSAFALPKFADFSGQAESSSLEGARGAMRSASAIAHAACLADSTCNASGATSSVSIEGAAVAMVYGYPSKAGIVIAANLDGYNISQGVNAAAALIISVDDEASSPCFTFAQATISAGTAPVISPPTIGTAATYNKTADTCP